MERFELLLHEEVLDSLREIRGEDRKLLRSFLAVLPSNPHLEYDASYEDRKGRIVSQIRMRNYLLEYIVDDPVKEIKVVELTQIIA